MTCFATTQVFQILDPSAHVHACDKHLGWKPFLEGVECRNCDLEVDALPYDDASFDLVVFTETLEHIPRSPYVVLGEIARVLKPGGVLLFSVPNLSNLTNRIKLLLGRNILSVERFYADSFGHFREYNLREVEHLLRQLKFDVRVLEYAYYVEGVSGRGGGLVSLKTFMLESLRRPLMALVPSLRPVCVSVSVKA